MCCVNSPTTVSTTSSQRGQIVSPDRPPSYSGGSPQISDEGFDGSGAKRSPAESGELIGDAAGQNGGDGVSELPPPIVDAGDESDGRAIKRPRAETGGGAGDAAAASNCGDRLGDLSDAILLSILSYLPLRDAARSTVLSSRWRRLFDQSLLDFNACQPFPPEGGRGCVWLIRAIDAILASGRPIRVRSFRFLMYGRGFTDHMGSVSGWFRVLASRGIREVDVNMFHMAWQLLLPASLLQLASLETLRVCFCDLRNADALQLPLLKTLHLSNVKMSEEALQAMLSHCPSLECAKLNNITGAEKICLRSKSLVRLYGGFGNLSELVVEDAPNLEELVGVRLPSSGAAVIIVFAPKLQVLGYLGINVRPIVLIDTVFDGGIAQSRTLMCSVKTLAIQVPFSEKGRTIFFSQLLKCFPCLETLCVEPETESVSQLVAPEAWDTTTSIQCFEHSLSKVVFENFGGQICHWKFLYYLLGMARALKVAKLYCLKGEDFGSRKINLLRTTNRAYPDVQFQFFTCCQPVSGFYLCHCCPRRCQNENRVSLL